MGDLDPPSRPSAGYAATIQRAHPPKDEEPPYAEGTLLAKRYRIARRQKRASGPAGAHGAASIVAPMPGKVVRLLVAPEQQVTAGQGIIVVEAMKMQNELKSPRDGRVTALNVKENDSVNAGAILAVIEG